LLNTSYEHNCHLASQFHLDPEDYEVLLIVANLALYMQFGFTIKPNAWGEFLGDHWFAANHCEIEFNQKRLTSMHT
jgi:hypothetical protein